MLDWIAAGFTAVSAWLLGEKNIWGWLVGIAGNVLWIIYALHVDWQLPIAILNVAFFGIKARGYFNWKEDLDPTDTPDG